MKLLPVLMLPILALASACQRADEMPARGDYTLTWYPFEGTDNGTIVPGFKRLDMCRLAGSQLTLQRLEDRYGKRASYGDVKEQPWYECGLSCSPSELGMYQVCSDVLKVHGVAAAQRSF
jgi:hypothetical protein